MPYLYDELVKYCGSDAYPFHMPGHKRRLGSFQDPFSIDITEIDGFDNLHRAEGILLEAERRAAKLYGAEETHFLVNGSTAGILSAVGAATTHGGRILMARASHKAAYHAAAEGGLETVYLASGKRPGGDMSPAAGRRPGGDTALIADKRPGGECGRPVDPDEVEQALAADALLHPEGGRIQAVYITSPTYDGVVSDVGRIAEIAHLFDIPLIVDEAHGAHFGMHPIFPESSVKLGADLVIHSLHKTLPSLTQTALIHVQGNLVDRRRLREMLDIYQTSSPSYVLMASIDNCIRILEEHGPELFGRFADNLKAFYHSISDLTRIGFIRTDDPSKILLTPLCPADPEAGGESRAKILYDTLRLRFRLQPEMLSRSYVCMLSSAGDSEEGFRRLSDALHEIDREWRTDSGKAIRDIHATYSEETRHGGETADSEGAQSGGWTADMEETQLSGETAKETPGRRSENESIYDDSSIPEAAMTIGAARDAPQEKVPAEESAGRISGEYLYLYPPGIPMIAPGERITSKLINDIRTLRTAGYAIEGSDDHSLRYLWCVR